MFYVEPSLCNGCAICARVCSKNLIEVDGDRKARYLPGYCNRCGHCYAACPTGAIKLEANPEDWDMRSVPTPGIGYGDLVYFLRCRRSIRLFQPTPVAPDLIEKIVDAARWSSATNNQRNLRMTVVTSRKTLDLLRRETVKMLRLCRTLNRHPFLAALYGFLDRSARAIVGPETGADIQATLAKWEGGSDSIFHHAPVVVVAYEPRTDLSPKDNSAFAMYNLVLAAHTLGLGTCICGWAQAAIERSRVARNVLQIPPEFTVTLAVAVGYPALSFKRPPPRPKIPKTFK